MKRVMIIAGGTGGHIFPALAVADELKKEGHTVFWLGARAGLETKLVPSIYPLSLISVKGVRNNGLRAKLLAPWQIFRAIIKAYTVIKSKKPDVVLAMGGYVALPGGLAAWLARVPLVIHEQNAKAGLTNRFLLRFSRVRLQAFSHAFSSSIRAKTVGNPVRQSLLEQPLPESRLSQRAPPLRVLIVGGSQGARALNQCVVSLWLKYPNLQEISVWHQTGEKDYVVTKSAYETLPIEAKVEAFIDEIATAYAWADVIICRAGAMTVSELAAVGAASILIPYPHAVDQHQHYNARYLSDQGAAILLDQKHLSPVALMKLLQKFINDKQCLLKMAQSAKNLAYSHAAQSVAKACLTLDMDDHSQEADNGC